MIQQFYFWVCTQKNWKNGLEEIFVEPYSPQRYSQQAKTQKQPNYLLTDECISKKYVHKIKCYSILKRNTILPQATRWLNLNSIMLSAITHSSKDKYCVPRVVKYVEIESRMVIARGRREEEMRSYCLMGTEFQFC